MTEQAKMRERITLAMQVFAAHLPEKRTNHSEFGQAIAEQRGNPETPYHPDMVMRWLDGTVIPDFNTAIAIAELVGYQASSQVGYLLYGTEHAIHGQTEEDYNRFYRSHIASLATTRAA